MVAAEHRHTLKLKFELDLTPNQCILKSDDSNCHVYFSWIGINPDINIRTSYGGRKVFDKKSMSHEARK